MYCNSCGADLTEGCAFCAKCGAPVGRQDPPDPQQNAFSYDAPAPQPSAGKPKKGLIVAVAVLLAVLLAGGGTLGFFLLRDKEEPDDEKDAKAGVHVETEGRTEAGTEAADEAETEAADEAETEAPVSGAKYEPGNYVNSTASVLNLRADHTTGSAVVGKVGMTANLTVTEVYEDPAAADPTLRWWGKTAANGKNGWIAPYYLTCTDLKNNVYTAQQVEALFNRLGGYYNTLDNKRFGLLSTEDGAPSFTSGYWESEYDFRAHTTGGAAGDMNGLLSVELYEPANGNPDTIYYEEVRAVLLLDLSEAENGRISWKVNEEWETGDFAGKTVNEAMP